MSSLTLTCPQCGFAREVEDEKVPDRPVRVRCPKCQGTFSFDKTASSPPPSPPLDFVAPSLPRPGSAKAAADLRGVGELFRDAWEIYLRRVGVLMGLYLLALLLLAAPLGLFLLGGLGLSLALPDLRLPLLVAGGLTGLVAGTAGVCWGLAALTAAVVDEDLAIRPALERGWGLLWAYAWVISLAGFIVTGGFLLFIVPGILFSVWFFFAQYLLVAGNERGMDALLASKACVRGRFFAVLVRLLAAWVVSLVLGLVPVAGPLLSLLFVPFMLIYSWLLCEDLRRAAGGADFSRATGEKAKWLLLGLLGFIVVPLLALLLAGFLGATFSDLKLPVPGAASIRGAVTGMDGHFPAGGF
jgi:predicted Zn finger-like uncharacterized protein